MERSSSFDGSLKSSIVKKLKISCGILTDGPTMTRQHPEAFQMGRLFCISWIISTEPKNGGNSAQKEQCQSVRQAILKLPGGRLHLRLFDRILGR